MAADIPNNLPKSTDFANPAFPKIIDFFTQPSSSDNRIGFELLVTR
jgi:hypothetical protein